MGTREDLQALAFEIIGYAGEALSNYYAALEKAKEGDKAQCDALLEKATEQMREAHHVQTDLLCKESEGQNLELSLIVVHAQDHLMNAILAEKLVRELIELHLERRT